MSTLRISDAPLLPDVDGTEKIPTGGRGDYAISVDQIKDHIFQDVGKELVGLGNVDNTSDLDKPVSTAQQAALDLKADKTYVDSNLDLKADKTNVYTRSETSLALSKKADLVNGVVPENQIPSSFNDVLEFTTHNLPIVGESGKIYVTTDTNKTWRWATNRYVEISGWNPDSVSKAVTIPTYNNTAVGVDPVTGVADGAYFNVRSTSDDTLLVEYQNVGGSAVATGESYPSGNYVKAIAEYTALPFKVGKSYALYERVMLESGDVVKNTVVGNTINPNSSMTGWAKTNSASQIFDESGKSQQWVNDKKTLKTFYDFGAKGDGVTDDTTAIRLATVYSAMYNVGIVQNDGEFLVSTFDQTLSDGIVCAIPIAGNLNLSGTGRIKSNTTTVNRAIFGVDSRANNKNIKINGVKFGGPRRYRVIHSTGDATLDSIDFSCVHTELQSIVLTSAYKKSIKVNNNKLGTAIDATTPITPFMEINIPLDSPHIPSYEVCRNSLWGGTETRTGTSYGFKNIPVGGKCDDNFLCNIGKSETEGFDIDGLGSFASFSGNVAIYSGFEYKPLVTGFYSRDAIFNNNISYESFGAAFSLRSSINANGNIAYNPTQFGLFMGVGGDPNGYVLNHGVADVSGFKIIWAGSTMDGAVRIENVFKRIVFDKLEITVDPAYATSNPTAKLSATSSGLITIIGDVNYVQFNDLLIGKSAVDQVNIRATTKVGTVIFNNPSFGDSDASCIDAQNVNNLVIHNPIFGDAADRAVRISLCDNVDIVSREYPFLANVLTTPTNTNALVNGFGIQAVGSAGAPTNPYRIGAIVQNSFDGSIWLKQTATWVKIGPAS